MAWYNITALFDLVGIVIVPSALVFLASAGVRHISKKVAFLPRAGIIAESVIAALLVQFVFVLLSTLNDPHGAEGYKMCSIDTCAWGGSYFDAVINNFSNLLFFNLITLTIPMIILTTLFYFVFKRYHKVA